MAELLSKRDLFDRVVEAIRASGWSVMFLPTPVDPSIRLRIYNGSESYNVRVYIWNVTHGGGSRRPAWEYRIQNTGVNEFATEPDFKTLILGWYAPQAVFAGYDYNKHAGPHGSSPSYQVSQEALESAAANLFAPYNKGNGEIVIAFRPDFMVEYIRQLDQLHSFGESQASIEALDALSRSPESTVDETLIPELTEPRRIALRSVRQKVRDARFRDGVLRAYGFRCAVCGVQLDLVEAAHIVPVADSRSVDHPRNGLALCVLHHKAYDNALITLADTLRIALNRDEIERLQQIGLSNGQEYFLGTIKQSPIIIPTNKSEQPDVDMLHIGNELRGWPSLTSESVTIL